MVGTRPAQGFSEHKPAVPQGSPQKSSAGPQQGAVLHRRRAQAVEDQQVTTASPAASSARRTAARVSAPPRGVAVHAHRVDRRGQLDRARRHLRRGPSPGRPAGRAAAAGRRRRTPVGEPLEPPARDRARAPVDSSTEPGIPSTGSSPRPVQHGRGLVLVVERPGGRARRAASGTPPRRPRRRRSPTGRRPARPPARAGRRPARRARPGRSSRGRRRTPGRRRDPAADGAGADGLHGGRRPGVEAAGHVGAGHHGQQALVVGDLLAQVGVEVDAARVPGGVHGPSLPGEPPEKSLRVGRSCNSGGYWLVKAGEGTTSGAGISRRTRALDRCATRGGRTRAGGRDEHRTGKAHHHHS